jgi:tripartite-type tricarboxylate transporter receptor subunit TctC
MTSSFAPLDLRRRRLLLGAAAQAAAITATTLATGPARAQTFPSRPLRLVVPFPAGGPTDAVAGSVIVEDKPGAVGLLGYEEVRRSPPEGYTLLSLVIPAVLNFHFLRRPFSVNRDLTPIGLISTQFNVMVVNPEAADMADVKTLPQLLQLARAKPGAIAYGSAGQGSLGHLTTARIAKQAGVTMLHVPCRGAQPAMTDVLGGQVPTMLADSLTGLPHLRSRRIRALAVTSAQRVPELPTVPTLLELGFPGMVATPWSGLATTPGVSVPIQARLTEALKAALGSPALKAKITSLGMTPHYLDPVAFATLVDSDFETYGKVIRENGITPE